MQPQSCTYKSQKKLKKNTSSSTIQDKPWPLHYSPTEPASKYSQDLWHECNSKVDKVQSPSHKQQCGFVDYSMTTDRTFKTDTHTYRLTALLFVSRSIRLIVLVIALLMRRQLLGIQLRNMHRATLFLLIRKLLKDHGETISSIWIFHIPSSECRQCSPFGWLPTHSKSNA